MNKKYNIIYLTGVFLIVIGCSAQKNTGLSRAYHNLTAKYNVLFNGTESFKDGLEKIDKEYKDDYSQILPIFKYSDKDVINIAGSEMDRTIKKCTKLITLHSITAKPKVRENKTLSEKEREFSSKKEYNMFVDDAYLLMAKAHFYKHEFELSNEVLKKVVNDFKNQPIIYEAQIWQAKIGNETAQFISSSDILTSLINNSQFPDKLLPDLYTTYADFYLKQKDFRKAIDYLLKSLEIEKHKKVKTRYLFILAQLFEKTGELKNASDYYSQVIKMNPMYDMSFNAHINRALTYEKGFGQEKEIENELLKMLNDDKNIEYQDQIYYALGNLSSKEGDKNKALEYYNKSIEVNKGNDQQKVRSYLIIAGIYYDIPDYPKAQAYYDSTVAKIDPDYPGYNEIFTKSKSLTRLVKEINNVKLSDSVLMLARLPKSELNEVINGLIAEERKKIEDTRNKEREERLDESFVRESERRNSSLNSSSSGSKWYFYNDAAKSMGYNEFKLKWGNRRLEDHWQRSSKALASLQGVNEEELSENVQQGNTENYSKLTPQYYLTNIPVTDSAIQQRYKGIETSLYNMGLIYENDLKDYNKAIETFKDLIKRFPASTYILSSYYNLYSIAKIQNNIALIDYYKNIIIQQFPESMYAKVLTNPEYFKEIEKEDLEIRNYYARTFDLYKTGNFSEVIARTDYARKTYSDHKLIPQFHYLAILSKGKLSDNNSFRDSLLFMIQKYPGTEIAEDAQNIVNYMDQEHPEVKEAAEIKISKELYVFAPEEPHLFIFALNKNINVNQLVFNVINYNLDNNDSLNLNVDRVNLNNLQNLITVKTFNNQEVAYKYLKSINSSTNILKDIPDLSLISFIISEKNFDTLLKDKSVDRYMKFYNENY